MELQELKNIWKQADPVTDQQVKVDLRFIKEISIGKTQSLLSHIKLAAILELVLNFIFISPLSKFIILHMAEPRFALPALVLVVIGVLTIAWDIYSLIVLSTLRYTESITNVQKRLATFNYRNLFRQWTLLYVLVPLSWGALLVIFCKAFINIDLYHYPLFLTGNVISSIAIVPIIIWFAKKFPDKKMGEALSFLESIKKFEQH